MAAFTSLAFVTPPPCSKTLLPADVLASGIQASVPPAWLWVPVGDTAGTVTPSPQCARVAAAMIPALALVSEQLALTEHCS